MIWILGKRYDLNTIDGRKGIMDLIDDCRQRQAPNDLAVLAYQLLRGVTQENDNEIA